MLMRRLGAGAAALTLGTLAVVGMQAPAQAAQTAPKGSNCPNPAGKYPPGQCKKGASDTTPTRGQSVTFTSGSGAFGAGQNVIFGICGLDPIGTTTTDSTGNATVTFQIPSSLSNGPQATCFTGGGSTVRVNFTLVGGSGAGGSSGSSLPRTGADHIVELGVAGAGLVVLGAGAVVVARRRRETGLTAA